MATHTLTMHTMPCSTRHYLHLKTPLGLQRPLHHVHSRPVLTKKHSIITTDNGKNNDNIRKYNLQEIKTPIFSFDSALLSTTALVK